MRNTVIVDYLDKQQKIKTQEIETDRDLDSTLDQVNFIIENINNGKLRDLAEVLDIDIISNYEEL